MTSQQRAHAHHRADCGSSQAESHPASRRGGRRSGFGVRRPLRFLARQLELDSRQVERLAALLDGLKIQRAQAAVDHKKATAAFADAFEADEFDASSVKQATEARNASLAEVERAVERTLEQTYALLERDQRKRLAFLLRTDELTI